MKAKYILILLGILIAGFCSQAQNEIIEAEFYLDQDPGFGNATPIDLTSAENISEVFSASLDDLDAGPYFAYVRVKDENNMWSIPLKVPFQVQKSALPDITSAEWFIGNDPGFGSGNPVDISTGETVDDLVSASTEGILAGRNFAYLRFQNADGNWSIHLKKAFVINDKLPLDVVAAEYFIDQDPGINMANSVEVINPDHFVEQTLMAEISGDLPEGDHLLYLRVQNDEGFWSIDLVRSFVVDNSLGLENALSESIKVYPNPSSGPITISTGNLALISLEVIDTKGQLVKTISPTDSVIHLSSLERGMYLLRITTTEGQLTKAIVVN